MAQPLSVPLFGVFVAMAAMAAPVHAQTNPCNAVKFKASAVKAKAKMGCHAKAVAKGIVPTDSTCLAKAEVKFSSTFAKVELKASASGVPCLTTGDAADVEASIDAMTDIVANELTASGPDTCESKKWKASADKAKNKLTCHAKAVAKAIGVDSTCLAKAEVKFSKSSARIDPTDTLCPGAAADVESGIDAAVSDIASALCSGCNLCPDCCSSFTRLTFTVGTASGDCGDVFPFRCVNPGSVPSGLTCDVNADCPPGEFCLGPLACGGLYFGGSGVSVPQPVLVPDMGTSVVKVASCDSATTIFDIEPATSTDTGSFLTCTSGTEPNQLYPLCVGGPNDGKPCRIVGDCPSPGTCTGNQPGCLFGPPLPVVNANVPATSVCVIQRIASDADGVGACSGYANIKFDVDADIYLTYDLAPSETGIQPCPICTGGTCKGGPNDGALCTPGSSDFGDAYPTSHDCPPPANYFVGTARLPFALSTAGGSLGARDTDGAGSQVNTFCGFCRDASSFAFENPPHSCVSNDECTTGTFTTCQQRSDGAFGSGQATDLFADGTQPSTCLGDGGVKSWTLGTAFCIPPIYNAVVDAAADFPGPGAMSVQGTVQLLP